MRKAMPRKVCDKTCDKLCDKICDKAYDNVCCEAFDNAFDKVCGIIDGTLQETKMTDQVNIAIDGMCGAGKTTLGTALAKKYDCNLFHMDDYFLRPEQRTAKRYAAPGGNVDYERFQSEVLCHLADENGLNCRPFDCSAMSLGEPRRMTYKRLNIIEGAYSCHPYFGDVYNLRFFVEISGEEQRKRILARNGAQMYKRFADEWIPMENRYFAAYGIGGRCIRISMM